MQRVCRTCSMQTVESMAQRCKCRLPVALHFGIRLVWNSLQLPSNNNGVIQVSMSQYVFCTFSWIVNFNHFDTVDEKLLHVSIWVFPKIGVGSPNHPF